MPICWNCDTEATEVYRDEHGVRKFLCDTCAEAWKSGYTYAANGSDTWPVPLDGWSDDTAPAHLPGTHRRPRRTPAAARAVPVGYHRLRAAAAVVYR